MALLRRIAFKVEIENEALLLCAIVFMVNLERPPAPGSVPPQTVNDWFAKRKQPTAEQALTMLEFLRHRPKKRG